MMDYNYLKLEDHFERKKRPKLDYTHEGEQISPIFQGESKVFTFNPSNQGDVWMNEEAVPKMEDNGNDPSGLLENEMETEGIQLQTAEGPTLVTNDQVSLGGNDEEHKSSMDLDSDDETRTSHKIRDPENEKKEILKEKLGQGKFFSSYEEFMEIFNEYKQLTWSVTRKTSSLVMKDDDVDLKKHPYQRVTHVCTHYGKKPKTRGRDIRVHQAYLAKECPFTIRVLFVKDKLGYIVKKFVPNHCNHELNEDYFRQHSQNRRLTNDELTRYIQKGTVDLGARNFLIRKQILEDTNKTLTAQDVINCVRKIRSSEGGKSELELLMKILKDNVEQNKGNTYKVYSEMVVNTENGAEEEQVTCIFYQSCGMKKLLKNFGSVIQIDATYKLLKCGYVLVPYVVMDNSGKCAMVGWAIISSDNAALHQTALQALVDSNPDEVIRSIKYAVIDKSMAEMKALCAVMPHIHFVICRFHAIQAVHRWVNKLHLTKNQQPFKSELESLFAKMVYSPDEAGYRFALNKICDIAEVAPELSTVKEYFEVNWHQNKEHFSLHCLRHEKIFQTFTNNRVENLNKQFKQAIKRQTSLANLVQVLFDIEEGQVNRMTRNSWTMRNKDMCKTNLIDHGEAEIQRIGQRFLSIEKLKDILVEYQKSKKVDLNSLNQTHGQIICPRVTGKCIFQQSESLPCQHLFAIRSHNQEALLERDMIDERWMKFYEPEDHCNNDPLPHSTSESNGHKISESEVPFQKEMSPAGKDGNNNDQKLNSSEKITEIDEPSVSENNSKRDIKFLKPEEPLQRNMPDEIEKKHDHEVLEDLEDSIVIDASEAGKPDKQGEPAYDSSDFEKHLLDNEADSNVQCQKANPPKEGNSGETTHTSAKNEAKNSPRSNLRKYLPRERYAVSRKACKDLPEIMFSLPKSEMASCIEQMKLLKHFWKGNQHSKVDCDEETMSCEDSVREPVFNKNTFEELCQDIPEILSKFSFSKMEHCLMQLKSLKTYWKQLWKTSISVFQVAEVQDKTKIGLVPKGKSHFTTKGAASGCFSVFSKAKGNAAKTQSTKVRLLNAREKKINKNMESIGCVGVWASPDFDPFVNENAKGRGLWLRDSNFYYTNYLLKKQYPDLMGLEESYVSNVNGFTPSEGKPFVQHVHCTFNHWVLLSNIRTPENMRDNCADLYDSLVTVTVSGKDSDASSIEPALTWQVAQVLIKNNHCHERSLFLTVRNCEQQRNTYDCGLFAMANEIALVHGFDPSTTFYSQTMRKQIFEMIEAGKLDQRIIAGQKNKESRHKFQKQETIGGVHKFVDIPERIIEILVMCHCQMPESFGNLLCCEKCLHQYHSCCYLISDDVAKALKTFVCYECREVGDYSFCETIYSTNMSSIANLVEIIKKKRDLKLGTFLPLVFAEPETRKVLISSLNQYQKFEKVMIEYDLNAVLSKGGSLYEAFLEICSTDSRRHKQFRKLNKAELMHFTVLTVCNLLDKDCEPLFSPGLPSGDRMSDNEAITFLKGNGNWIKKIKKELKQVTNKIDKQSAKKGKKKSFPDFLRTSKRNIEAAKRFAMDVLKITPGANLSSSTITKFEKLINESKDILISVEIYEKKLEDLENQYFE